MLPAMKVIMTLIYNVKMEEGLGQRAETNMGR